MDSHSLYPQPFGMFPRTQTGYQAKPSDPPHVFLKRTDQSTMSEPLSEEDKFVKEFKDFCTRHGLRPFSRAVILTHYLLAKTWPDSYSSGSGSEGEPLRP